MAAAVFVKNLCGGMGTAAFVALLMTLCNKFLLRHPILPAVGPLAGWFVVIAGLGLLMLCRTTLTATQQTDAISYVAGHFGASYRLAQRLLATGGAMLLAKAVGMASAATLMNWCWEIGAVLLSVSILMGCVLDYRTMKRSRPLLRG